MTDAQALAHMLVNPDLHVARGDTVWNDAAALVATALLVTARLSPEPTLGHFHALLHDLMAGRPVESPHPWAADMIGRVWKTWHEKTRSSVFFNLESRLAFLASELVQAVLSGDDFRADDLMAATSRSPCSSARRCAWPSRCGRCTGCCSPPSSAA